jgi:hydrogenase expression/formation protein HypD
VPLRRGPPGPDPPNECEQFGITCTPRNPLGATMVSSEGACAAYYQYRRLDLPEKVQA